MKNLLILAVLSMQILNVIACRKQPLPDPDPCPAPCDTIQPTSKLDIVWQVPLLPDSSSCLSRMPLIFNDKVLFTDQFNNNGEFFYTFFAANGERSWSWKDNKTGSSTGPEYGLHFANNHIIASMGSSYFIDPHTGENKWWIYIDGSYCASKNSTVIGNYFYQILFPCTISGTVSILRRTPLDLSMTWDTVCIYRPEEEDNWEGKFEPPALWIHPSGDSILIFKNRMQKTNPNFNRADLWAWNLSADSLLWKVKRFTASGHTRIGPPTIYNNKVYVYTGGSEIHCIDALTGNHVWLQKIIQFSGGFNTAQPLIAEGILFVKSTDWNAYGLSPETGAIIWKREGQVGTCESLLAYHDGKVYYTGFDLHPGTLYALDIHTGKTVWAEPSPALGQKRFSNASFAYNGVAIDPVRKVLYASDYYFAYCIKLPD